MNSEEFEKGRTAAFEWLLSALATCRPHVPATTDFERGWNSGLAELARSYQEGTDAG